MGALQCCMLVQNITDTTFHTCIDFNVTHPASLVHFDFSLCPPPPWSEWSCSECSVTCGPGIRMRNRTCLDEREYFYREPGCIGNDTDVVSCTLDPCTVPIDGGWSEWQNATCSVTCGTGIKLRNRTCDNPAPALGGKYCIGDNVHAELCTLDKCVETCESVGGVCLKNKKKCKGEILCDKICKSCHHKCCKKTSIKKKKYNRSRG